MTELTDSATVYHSKIDWWVWAIMIVYAAVLLAAGIGGIGWVTFSIFFVGFEGLFIALILGCRYAIEGDSLIVYQFFYPMRLPIKKIKDIKYHTGILAAPALSTNRLAIRFADRAVLKSAMPIEISPKDRERFVTRLLEINPEIDVIKA